jgi:hypothetical protein
MLTHFKTFGALLNNVKAEQLLELEDFHLWSLSKHHLWSLSPLQAC